MARTAKSPKKTAKSTKAATKTETSAAAKTSKSTKSDSVVAAPATTTVHSRRVGSLSFGQRLKIGLRATSPSRLLAEFIGTFVLTGIVATILGGKFSPISYFVPQNILERQLTVAQGQSLTAAVDKLLQQSGVIPFVATAVFAAITITVLTLVIGRISGAHLNPAITLARMTQRVTRLGEGAFYIVAQLLAAMLAITVVAAVGSVEPNNLILHRADWSLFYGELLGAFVFGFGTASAALYARSVAVQANIIGGSYLLGAVLAAAGGSKGLLNPALAVGTSAFATGDPAQRGMLLAAYVGAPILGAVIGFALFRLLSRDVRRVEELVEAE